MELTDCDGVNDWKLVCPNSCHTVDDSLRHFITTPAQDRIAVWGDHDPIWTGEGPEGLQQLVTNRVFIRFSSKNIIKTKKSCCNYFIQLVKNILKYFQI